MGTAVNRQILAVVLLALVVGGVFCAGLSAAWAQEPPGRRLTEGFTPDGDGTDGDGEERDSVEVAGPPEDADPVDAMFARLSLRERVAQLMFVTLQGAPRPDSEDVHFMRNYPPGGVIVPSLAQPTSAVTYVSALRDGPPEATKRIPLFIATNMFDLPRREGTLRGRFTQFPSMLALAAANHPEATNGLAQLIGEHAETLGFNMHFGPSLELAPTLRQAPGSVHYPGSDPVFASMAAETIVEELRGRNVLSVPMGFPGGGGNRTRNHPPILYTPESALASHDLLGFASAIQAGAEAIHVSNTIAPTIDPRRVPSSISPLVITELLRDKMGFDGLVIAGPMDSRDVSEVLEPSDAAQMALEAGADMILWDQAGTRVRRAVDSIAHAMAEGELDPAVVNRAVRRVLQVKYDHGLLERERPDRNAAARLERRRTYPQAAYEAERRSITLVQNRGVLPLRDETHAPIGVTGVIGERALFEGLEEHLDHIVRRPMSTAQHAGAIHDFEIRRLTGMHGGFRTVVCVLTPDERIDGQRELIRQLQASGAKVVVVLLGYPRTLPELTDADAIVLAYGGREAYQQTMRAVADVLVGKGPLRMIDINSDLRTEVGKEEVFSIFDLIRAPAGRLPVTLEEPFVKGYSVGYDPSEAIRRVEWRFGEGSRAVRGSEVTHTFREPGRYPVTVTVTDTEGDTVTGRFYTVVE